MGAHQKILIRVEQAQAEWFLMHHGFGRPTGSWVSVEGESDAQELSKHLDATVIELSIQTTADQIWIHGYHRGQHVRELLYNEGRWTINRGEPFAFEDRVKLRRFLKRNDLLASPDGYDVLDAVLGAGAGTPGSIDAEYLSDDVTPGDVPRGQKYEEPPAPRYTQRTLDARYAAPHLHLVRLTRPLRARLEKLGVEAPSGSWLSLPVTEQARDASLMLETVAIVLEHDVQKGSCSATGFDNGQPTRSLAIDPARGLSQSGLPFSFEDAGAIAKWSSKKGLPSFARFLEAVLGEERTITEGVRADHLIEVRGPATASAPAAKAAVKKPSKKPRPAARRR